MFCPHCLIDLGEPLNDAFAGEGDLYFCRECGAMAIVGSDLELRTPTYEEDEAARRDPEVRWIAFAMKMAAARRRV
jgi:hypothetical protein